MSEGLQVIHSHAMTREDGIEMRLTISTQDGAPVSPEDRAFISRYVPLGALEVVVGEE